MNPLEASLRLIRLRHTGQVVGIVTILSLRSHGISQQSLLAIASSLFFSIAVFAFDDAHDYVSDGVVHSQRPIPQGKLSIKQVYLIGTIALAISILSALGLFMYQFILFMIAVLLGLCVIFLRMRSIIRALLSATMIYILFPFSAAITLKILLFGLIVVLPHIAGSISKDVIHSQGDEKIGLQSPIKLARYVASVLFFLSGGIIFLPLIFDLVPWLYLPLIVPTLFSCLLMGYQVLHQQYQQVYLYGGIGMVSTLVTIALNI